MTKKRGEAKEQMITTRLDFETHTALKLLHNRLKKERGGGVTINDAVKEFITEHDPAIMSKAKELAVKREELARELGDEL